MREPHASGEGVPPKRCPLPIYECARRSVLGTVTSEFIPRGIRGVEALMARSVRSAARSRICRIDPSRIVRAVDLRICRAQQRTDEVMCCRPGPHFTSAAVDEARHRHFTDEDPRELGVEVVPPSVRREPNDAGDLTSALIPERETRSTEPEPDGANITRLVVESLVL
jgi:hypothetical protein